MSQHLIRIYQEQRHLEDLRLEKDSYLVGRGQGCTILLDDPSVSRRHLMIRRVASFFLVENLGGSNPVFLNEKPLHKRRLTHGDRIGLGRHTLVYLEGPGKGLLEPPEDSEGMHIVWSSQEATSYVDSRVLMGMRPPAPRPVIEMKDRSGRPHLEMKEERLTLGRGPRVDLQVRSLLPFVKAMAQLIREEDRCRIERLSPWVSVRVNGQRCSSRTLEDGDMIQVARSRFAIHIPARDHTPSPEPLVDPDGVIGGEDEAGP